MVESISEARRIAASVRYEGDVSNPTSLIHVDASNTFRDSLLQNAVEISAALTPSLWRSLTTVCVRLRLPPDTVTAFVYSSAEIQAECYAGSSSQCIVRLSSSLVSLLDDEEFEFVLGHELGHFLLDHGQTRTVGIGANFEYFLQRRAQEISVDRIGLLACGSLETSIRSLMKTVSGLTQRHLRFDVGAFVSQLRRIRSPGVEESQSTHPSMLILSKALLWFSLSDCFSKGIDFLSPQQLMSIDKKITLDLARFVNAASERQFESAKQDLFLWMLTQEIIQQGAFSKSAQTEMSTIFGDDTVNSLRRFLSEASGNELEGIVFDKISNARARLESMAPNSFMLEVHKLDAEKEKWAFRIGVKSKESF